MFETHKLRNMSNAELIALANDEYALALAVQHDLYRLVHELSNRFEAMDYMVQETSDGKSR